MCALNRIGYSDCEIMKMGRWAPDSISLMEYIQQQLSTFSEGMATDMSRIAKFTNMEGRTSNEDLWPLTIF